jgi:hypothetical protein
MLQSHSISTPLPTRELSFRKSAIDDACTTSSPGRYMNSPQPMVPIRSYSDSSDSNETVPSVLKNSSYSVSPKRNKTAPAVLKKSSPSGSPKVNKTVRSVFEKSSYTDSPKLNKTVLSVFKRKRPHPRRSAIMRSHSGELLKNDIKSRARAIKFNKKIFEKMFGRVSRTNPNVQATVQLRKRVQKLAAERGRVLSDIRELHRTIRRVIKGGVRGHYERRATIKLQAIARGYLIRMRTQKKKQVALLYQKQLSSPFTPVRNNLTRRRPHYPREYSEITMSDFGGSPRSLVSCPLSAAQMYVTPPMTPSAGHPSHFEVWTEEDATLDDDGSIDEDEYMMSPTLQEPRSTDEPSWNPVGQTEFPIGDEHRLSNCFNDSINDIPAMQPSRCKSVVKHNADERLAPHLSSVLPTINLVEDDDLEDLSSCSVLYDEDEESLCSIPPLMKVKKREELHSSCSFTSSFSSVFGASQDSDVPLSRPSRSRSLSPLVSSPADNFKSADSMSSLQSLESTSSSCSSFLELSGSMAEF